MSFWFYRRDSQNKKQLWQVDVPLELVLLLTTGFLFSLIVPAVQLFSTPFVIAAGLITLTGLILLVLCKLSLFRRGIWVSWGSSHMSKVYASLYKLGYGLLFVGLGFFALVTRLAV
jgi:hypothetical protein